MPNIYYVSTAICSLLMVCFHSKRINLRFTIWASCSRNLYSQPDCCANTTHEFTVARNSRNASKLRLYFEMASFGRRIEGVTRNVENDDRIRHELVSGTIMIL